MRELERDVFKVAMLGIFGVIVIKGITNAGGIAQIAKALFGGYNDTLGTLSRTQ